MFFIVSLVKHILTVRVVQRLKIQINKTIVHFFSRASILIFKGFSIEYYTTVYLVPSVIHRWEKNNLWIFPWNIVIFQVVM